MFGFCASARIFRPSSAFVPSSRTTIGYFDMSSRSSASRMPRANASIGSAAAVSHLGDVRMPVQRVVVDGELRVERLDLAVRRDDQRVDLGEHRVELLEHLVELLDDRGDLLLLRRVLDTGAVDE